MLVGDVAVKNITHPQMAILMDLQQSIALLFAVLATAYLVRRGWRSIRGKATGCGTCSACPADASEPNIPPRKKLYTLGDPK